MRKPRLLLVPAVLLPLTLGIAACGGSSDSAGGGSYVFNPPSVSTSDSPTGEPTDEPTDAATDLPTDVPTAPTDTPTDEPSDTPTDLPAGVTPAGTQLKIGDTATVDYALGTEGDHGILKLTLDSIDKGTAADLKPLKLGDQAAGQVPWYVRYTVTGGEGSHSLKFYTIGAADFDGLLPDGGTASPLIVFGTWDKCEVDDFPEDFGPGKSIKVCLPFLAGQGTKVVGAWFAQSGTAYDQFDGKPIVWK